MEVAAADTVTPVAADDSDQTGKNDEGTESNMITVSMERNSEYVAGGWLEGL